VTRLEVRVAASISSVPPSSMKIGSEGTIIETVEVTGLLCPDVAFLKHLLNIADPVRVATGALSIRDTVGTAARRPKCSCPPACPYPR
jgi:hypothetical protein